MILGALVGKHIKTNRKVVLTMQLYFILSLIASIIIIVFAITNSSPVPVNVFFAKYELSLALVIFISTAFGAIIASSIGFVNQFKLKKEIKNLKNKNSDLEKENQNLREESSAHATFEEDMDILEESKNDI